MESDFDAIFERDLVARIRRLEAKRAKLDRELDMLRKLRAENEKRAVPVRIRLRRKGVGKVAAHNRIIRFLEDQQGPVRAKLVFAMLLKVDPEFKASTFRSHMKRLSDAGIVTATGSRGSYALIKRENEIPVDYRETPSRPFRYRAPERG